MREAAITNRVYDGVVCLEITGAFGKGRHGKNKRKKKNNEEKK